MTPRRDTGAVGSVSQAWLVSVTVSRWSINDKIMILIMMMTMTMMMTIISPW